MENSISVFGHLNQKPDSVTDETSEESISNEEIFVASAISTGSLPKTGDLTSSDFVFLGVLLCLAVMILRGLRKTSLKNR